MLGNTLMFPGNDDWRVISKPT